MVGVGHGGPSPVQRTARKTPSEGFTWATRAIEPIDGSSHRGYNIESGRRCVTYDSIEPQ